jgi:hypothetical protein
VHTWGSEDVDWDTLWELSSSIPRDLRRWGRIAVHGKEKFGTLRLDLLFFGFTLHGFIFPGYMYKHPRFPEFLFAIDLQLQEFYDKVINPWYIPCQKWVYKKVLSRAVRKHPHLTAEILADTDIDWLE